MNRRRSICRALDFIDANIGSSFGINDLAAHIGYSVPQLIRLFNNYAKISPMRYVNISRIIKSAQLLRNTDSRIIDIAFECGFESIEVFERSFKRYFGITASEYRLGNQIEPSPFYLSEQIYYERLRHMNDIDSGNTFDWGRTAGLYAQCRNIYPSEFFETLNNLGIGAFRQNILDIGTGPGILPINMANYGGNFIGVDKSGEMIIQAKMLAGNIPNVKFVQADAHNLPFETSSFDVVTALQCWVYFDKSILIPELKRVLRDKGELYIMFMTWLPDEDELVRKSFALIHKYNPTWSGYMKRTENFDFPWLKNNFTVQNIVKRDYRIPFTRESWCERLTASRGVGATLSDSEITAFRSELMDMLNKNTDENFSTLHESVIIKLRKE